MKDDLAKKERVENGIRAVRVGHGANCSSVGSVIDTLFVSAVVGGAIFAAIAAALAKETITVVRPSEPPPQHAGERGEREEKLAP